jgi:hypothetical protein
MTNTRFGNEVEVYSGHGERLPAVAKYSQRRPPLVKATILGE